MKRSLNTLPFVALAFVVLATAYATAGDTNFISRLIVQDSSGGEPTCSNAASDGEICAEADIEALGDLYATDDITAGDDLTVTDDATVGGDLTITGYHNGMRLKTDEISISNAELIALRATNKTLVAAQGANTIIVPVSVVFFLDYGSAQCTESADNLELHYVDASGDVACTAFETTGSWLVAAADGYGHYTCDQNILATTAQAVNTALTLDNNGDGEFGTCTGSTVTAWITYYVLDVS